MQRLNQENNSTKGIVRLFKTSIFHVKTKTLSTSLKIFHW